MLDTTKYVYRYHAREAVVITTASPRQKEEEQTGDTGPRETPYENSAASATNPEQSVAYATMTSMVATTNTTRFMGLGHKCGVAIIAHLPLICLIRSLPHRYSIQKTPAHRQWYSFPKSDNFCQLMGVAGVIEQTSPLR
jgi:hypothetical protein